MQRSTCVASVNHKLSYDTFNVQQYCNSSYAQQFINNVPAKFCSRSAYYQELENLQSAYIEEQCNGFTEFDEDQLNYYSTGYFETCQFCDQLYDVSTDLAATVGLYLHLTELSVSAQFIPKRSSQPILISPYLNAHNICKFCLKQLAEIDIPRILRSFQLTVADLDEILAIKCKSIPKDLIPLMLEFANPNYRRNSKISSR